MSYDLAAIEKEKIPADKAEFLKWFNKNMENDSVDITGTSENLQKFFHSIRRFFPPMNGEFAPDEKELSENPDLENKLCEYDIKKDMIYLCFPYSISRMTYEIFKRAVYFSGLGFFNPNENDPPVLFDSRLPMLLEGEWFRPLEINSFNDIQKKLYNMTAINRSFIYITDPVGNYIQAGGYGERFTVEKRIFSGVMDYVHYKAQFSGGNENKEDFVFIAGNEVKLKQNQIFSKDQTERLFLDFFDNTENMPAEWTEMDI